ncbi:hypothetical protein [Methylosinus sp. RM1]|uniref:hypothetical protein n=1 Tax=Methylosinus sp. RM1 TaxID=2583817 RepID=UPI00140AF549|nr:hypothetical protein [Methylosinus sp. RM1]
MMDFGRFLVAAVVAGAWSSAASEERPNPSFSCNRAVLLDEIAICSDARLAELDRIRAEDFRRAKLADPKEAVKVAQATLEARRGCANDRVCILDALRYASDGSPEPKWVEGYRGRLVQEVVADDLRRRSSAAVGRRGSFATSSKGVQATLMSIDGLDTGHASATGVVTPADFLEYCERDPGGETTRYGGKLSIRQCADRERMATGERTLSSKADCKAKTVTLWDGAWRFLSYDIGITWRGPKGDVQEPWAGTAAAEAQFNLLCPNTFARIRADAGRKSEAPSR